MWVHGRTQKGYCLITILSLEPYLENDTHSLPFERDCRTVKVFPGFMSSSVVLPGLLAVADPRKILGVVEKIRCRVCHIFHCALGDGFSVYPFLKSPCTDFEYSLESVSVALVLSTLRKCVKDRHYENKKHLTNL